MPDVFFSSNFIFSYHGPFSRVLTILLGEALNIDLDGFVQDLYALILPLCTELGFEDDGTDLTSATSGESGRIPDDVSNSNVAGHNRQKKRDLTRGESRSGSGSVNQQSLSALLFRALDALFLGNNSQRSAAHMSLQRAAAFSSRLLVAAPYLPPSTCIKSLELVHTLLVRLPALEALLTSEDRARDGGNYRAEMDDVNSCHPFGGSWFTLFGPLLRHADADVRAEAQRLVNYVR
jgi:nucleolar complex protein 3